MTVTIIIHRSSFARLSHFPDYLLFIAIRKSVDKIVFHVKLEKGKIALILLL